jgi:hypothetical protein
MPEDQGDTGSKLVPDGVSCFLYARARATLYLNPCPAHLGPGCQTCCLRPQLSVYLRTQGKVKPPPPTHTHQGLLPGTVMHQLLGPPGYCLLAQRQVSQAWKKPLRAVEMALLNHSPQPPLPASVQSLQDFEYLGLQVLPARPHGGTLLCSAETKPIIDVHTCSHQEGSDLLWTALGQVRGWWAPKVCSVAPCNIGTGSGTAP